MTTYMTTERELWHSSQRMRTYQSENQLEHLDVLNKRKFNFYQFSIPIDKMYTYIAHDH
jgi:hypothetical protein